MKPQQVSFGLSMFFGAIACTCWILLWILPPILENSKPTQPKIKFPFPAWKCTQVVGSTRSTIRVFKCLDPDTNKCFYINHNGGILETSCMVHPLAD